jgi:sugar O-acyltransferase (sialic acid O-acetyltransferase NeuD family)
VTIPVVIIGAGGHGREVLDLLRAAGHAAYDVLGFLDDGQPDLHLLDRLGLPHLGPVASLEAMAADVRYVLGVGSGSDRSAIAEWARSTGKEAATLVHPTATVGSDVELGEGVIICAHASVTTHARLGRHVHLNVASTVAHDAVVGDFVTLSPGCRLSGNVTLGHGVTLGTGAVVIPGVSIGAETVIGAGAVVITDLPGGVTAVGVPARVVHKR